MNFDFMQKTKVCLIIKNKEGELLLQLRDEDPEIGKWVLFGGGVNGGETPQVALAREIKEELGYKIKRAEFFKEYVDNGIRQMIYILCAPVEIEKLQLAEGAAMKFFAHDDLDNLAIGFNFKEIIDDYRKKMIKI